METNSGSGWHNNGDCDTSSPFDLKSWGREWTASNDWTFVTGIQVAHENHWPSMGVAGIKI